MATTAQSILLRASRTLIDNAFTRWTVSELVDYLNDGQREVVKVRPDATSTTTSVALTPGFKQSLPAGGTKLLDVIKNSAGRNRAVRMVNRDLLDAQVPGWYGEAATLDIQHFMYDPREPKVFYVYPPAASGAALDIIYSALPVDVPLIPEDAPFSSVAGEISISDLYANALQDYVLFRAYSKDSEEASVTRAAAHYSAFTSALTAEMQATVGFQPNPRGAPNKAGARP
jgi:hypothetical protein